MSESSSSRSNIRVTGKRSRRNGEDSAGDASHRDDRGGANASSVAATATSATRHDDDATSKTTMRMRLLADMLDDVIAEADQFDDGSLDQILNKLADCREVLTAQKHERSVTDNDTPKHRGSTKGALQDGMDQEEEKQGDAERDEVTLNQALDTVHTSHQVLHIALSSRCVSYPDVGKILLLTSKATTWFMKNELGDNEYYRLLCRGRFYMPFPTVGDYRSLYRNLKQCKGPPTPPETRNSVRGFEADELEFSATLRWGAIFMASVTLAMDESICRPLGKFGTIFTNLRIKKPQRVTDILDHADEFKATFYARRRDTGQCALLLDTSGVAYRNKSVGSIGGSAAPKGSGVKFMGSVLHPNGWLHRDDDVAAPIKYYIDMHLRSSDKGFESMILRFHDRRRVNRNRDSDYYTPAQLLYNTPSIWK